MNNKIEQTFSNNKFKKLLDVKISTSNINKKKDYINLDKINISPSPIKKNSDMSHELKSTRVELSGVSQQKTLRQSKIMIRQQQLVQFTKKFAIQKADYEDKIEVLEKQNDRLKSKIYKNEQELKKIMIAYNTKEQFQNKILNELNNCKQQNNKLSQKISNFNLNNRQLENQYSQLKTEILKIQNQLNYYKKASEDLIKTVKLEQQKNSKLVFDIQKLREQNQAQRKIVNQKILENIQIYNEMQDLRKKNIELDDLNTKLKAQIKQINQQMFQEESRRSYQLNLSMENSIGKLNRLKKQKTHDFEVQKLQYCNRISQLELEIQQISQEKNMNQKQIQFLKIQLRKKQSIHLDYLTRIILLSTQIQRKNQVNINQESIIQNLEGDREKYKSVAKNKDKDIQCQELKRKINLINIQNQHLQGQLEIQKENIEKFNQILQQNQNFQLELNQKNKKIFQLTTQIGNLKKKMSIQSHDKQIISKQQDHQILIKKCCQLESHIQILNKKIIFLQTNQRYSEEQSYQSIQHTDQYQIQSHQGQINQNEQMKKKYYEIMNDMQNLRKYTEQKQKQKQQFMHEYEYMKGQVSDYYNLQGQNKRNLTKIKIMQQVIDGMKRQNEQLKRKILSNNGQRCQNQIKEDLKEIIYQISKQKIEFQQEVDSLKNENRELRSQLIHYKELYNQFNKKNGLNHTINLSNLKQSKMTLQENKRNKINQLLKKVAQFSKEISFSNDENPLDIQLYSTIVNKLIEHIQNLQREKNSFQKQSYSPENLYFS